MAIVETLEVRFQANLGDLSARLNELSARFTGLSTALEAGRVNLAAGAQGLIRTVADGLRNGASASTAPAEAGAALAGGFASALQAGMPSAASAARQLSQAADFSSPAALAAAISAGSALGQGFAGGLASKYGAVMAAADRIANAAVARIRSALSIHSPSRVSFEMGGYFGEGFADGIRASVRMARDEAGALSAGTVQALGTSANPAGCIADGSGMAGMVQAAVQQALGGASITIPLHVDGMKLGEASIRGINRVTRSAGRLMLEI